MTSLSFFFSFIFFFRFHAKNKSFLFAIDDVIKLPFDVRIDCEALNRVKCQFTREDVQGKRWISKKK
jgi:hypothetical protein